MADPQTDAQWIRKVSLRDKRTGYAQTLPLMCQHCEHPPCVDVCPTGASFKRDDGIVLVDKHTCIGCRYCVMACPYGARSFVHEAVSGQKADVPRGKGTVESCTLCVHRVDRGETPACVEACNRDGGKAMVFGDLNDASTEIHRRLKQRALEPDPRRPRAQHRRALPGPVGHGAHPVPRDRRPQRRLLRAARRARRPDPRRPRRRLVHGAPRPLRHRHEQPHRVGHAARVRGVPDRRRLGRAQRRLDRLGVRPGAVQAARPALRRCSPSRCSPAGSRCWCSTWGGPSG